VDPFASQVVEAVYAAGIGLAIGLEREHSDLSHDLPPGADPDGKPPAKNQSREVGLGVRTFALIALVGWTLAVLGDANTMIQPIGMLAVGILLTGQFVVAARKTGAIGATTEIAAIAVLVIGGLVHTDRRLAVVLGLGCALLLVSKPWMRRQVVRLRHVEVAATIQLAVLVAIVLPLLPTEPIDPWEAVPPRKVGLFVVLIAGVEYLGYVATRLLGANRGAVVTGLVGGVSSSTATTVSMARSTKAGQAIRPAQLAALLANVVMCVRIIAVTAVLAPPLAWRLVIAMGAMALVLVGVAVATWLEERSEPAKVESIELKNPFSLIPALTLGAVLCAILVVSKLATAYFGDEGFLVAAAASGLADVDGIVLAAARGGVSLEIGALAIVIAATANSISKAVLSISVGGVAFGRRVAVGLLAGAAVAIVIAVVGISI
jgi:uncharacterized membrane protein (DUF4010 family)